MRFQKILWLCLLCLTLALCLLPCAAEGEATGEADAVPEMSSSENENAAPENENAAPPDTEPVPASAAEGTGISDRLVAWAGERIGEIFCALTFVGSMVLAWLYKKGLLPALSGSLSAISGSVKSGMTSLSAAADTLSASTEKTLSDFASEIKPVLSRVSAAAEGAEAVSGVLSRLQEQLSAENEDRARLKTVLRGQMGMFYDFFMAVNLPQYQKDRLGEVYGKLTAEINGDCRE